MQEAHTLPGLKRTGGLPGTPSTPGGRPSSTSNPRNTRLNIPGQRPAMPMCHNLSPPGDDTPELGQSTARVILWPRYPQPTAWPRQVGHAFVTEWTAHALSEHAGTLPALRRGRCHLRLPASAPAPAGDLAVHRADTLLCGGADLRVLRPWLPPRHSQ